MDLDLSSYIRRIQQEDDVFIKATLLRILTGEYGVSIKSIAQQLKLSPSYVCNVLRILKLPDLVRDGYYSGLVSPTHLFIISRLHKEKDVIEVYEEILQQNLTTNVLEEKVRERLYNIESDGEHISERVKNSLVDSLHTIDPALKVKVIQSRIRAKVVIELSGGLKHSTLVLEKIAHKLQNSSNT